MGHNLDSDMVGDHYLFSRLRKLADPALPAPLVTLSGDPTSMRACAAALTDLGRAVVEGRENFIRLNGIDDWVLGVHLDSASGGRVWYRTDDRCFQNTALTIEEIEAAVQTVRRRHYYTCQKKRVRRR